jgi:hypothetical protein
MGVNDTSDKIKVQFCECAFDIPSINSFEGGVSEYIRNVSSIVGKTSGVNGKSERKYVDIVHAGFIADNPLYTVFKVLFQVG